MHGPAPRRFSPPCNRDESPRSGITRWPFSMYLAVYLHFVRLRETAGRTRLACEQTVPGQSTLFEMQPPSTPLCFVYSRVRKISTWTNTTCIGSPLNVFLEQLPRPPRQAQWTAGKHEQMDAPEKNRIFIIGKEKRQRRTERPTNEDAVRNRQIAAKTAPEAKEPIDVVRQ